jgi:chloramphenicol-sensitive protein RarD
VTGCSDCLTGLTPGPSSDGSLPLDVSERRKGLIFGLTAYTIWGLFPLYWPLLEPATPLEILANRIVWSLVAMVVILAVVRRWSWIRQLRHDLRRVTMLAAAAILVAGNWGVYIYAVNTGRVVEASLGYFINPLVSIAFGVVLLHETLRRTQRIAVVLGVVAVIVLSVGYGHIPFIALFLALSFGGYGLLKKRLNMGAAESVAAETALLVIPAVVLLGVLSANGSNTFTSDGPGHAALLAFTGPLTVTPLLLFGGAAIRVPLVWMGLMQYVTPTLQFGIGVGIDHEPMSTAQWIGFVLVWVALALVAMESLQAARRGRAASGFTADPVLE